MAEIINNNVHLGSDLKLRIDVNFGELDKSTNFDVIICVPHKQIVFTREQLVKVSDSTYFACIKNPELNMPCKVNVFIRMYVPDPHFSDGTHIVVEPIDSQVRIV